MRLEPWHVASAVVAALALSSLVVSSETAPVRQSWYAVNGVLPGENVPDWVHSGQRYLGIPMPGRLVQIFSSDTERSIVLNASLLTRVKARES
jgi:hypothetical protein